MTIQQYKSLGLEERRVLLIAALVPVGIRTENGADGKPRYPGFADLLGAESHAARVEVLAADRAHRIGQSRPVTIYRLIARDTVEERVLALHKEKRNLAADMLDGTSGAALSETALMALLKGGADDGMPAALNTEVINVQV